MPKRSALPDDLKREFDAALTKVGITTDLAKIGATACVGALIRLAGGDQLYVPTKDLVERDWQIWEDFDKPGVTHIQLAQRYGITERSGYLIIERMKALHHKKTQPTLPGVDPE